MNKRVFISLIGLLVLLVSIPLILCNCNHQQIPDDGTADGTTEYIDGDSPVTDNEKNEQIEHYRQLAANFDTDDFGRMVSFTPTADIELEYYPEKGSHPRLWVTQQSLEQVIQNLSVKENEKIYQDYYNLSRKKVTGKLKSNEDPNTDPEVYEAIEAQAFRYLTTGDKLFGYNAIYAVKNAILTAKATIIDPFRYYGRIMYTAACVYDWCYDLLTEEDKTQIANGCVSLLGAKMEIGAPPAKEGFICDHTSESQIYRDWLSLAIAVYDEHPEIYEYVMTRIYDEAIPAVNYFAASGAHWEGSMYGPFRVYWILNAQLLMERMTNGKCKLFSDDLHRMCQYFMHNLRPDDSYFRYGDCDEESRIYLDYNYLSMAFLGSVSYNDAQLKSYYYFQTNGFSAIPHNHNYISPIQFLILNNPDLEILKDSYEGLSLVNVTNYPFSSVIARSAWNDKNAVAVMMRAPEAYLWSHAHMDCGSFQIYYKGILASNSGYYDSFGSSHHYNYSQMSISSNTLLVYNAEVGSSKQHVYSGGQTMIGKGRLYSFTTLDKYLSASTESLLNQSRVMGEQYDFDEEKFRYAYLSHDMTKAYDKETVDEVTRTMLAVMTENESFPMVYVIYDRILADSPSYKKTFLLHAQEKPTITSDGVIVVTNDGGGQLVAQSCVTETDAVVFGGDGEEYRIGKKVYLPSSYDKSNPEYRIEISPIIETKRDDLVTVMYVCDEGQEILRADSFEDDTFVGATI